jgi:phage tail sheath protein FI
MSRPIGEIRPPGVYISHVDALARAYTLADTRIAGFVGLAARGPLDVPMRITSWDQFCDVYSNADVGHLAKAVEGFFLNGGRTCHVVRVAHRARGEQQPDVDHAFCAERVTKDGWEKPTLRVRAKSEGRWGNNIWARWAQTVGAKALLTADLDVGAGEAMLNVTRGFERGALVRVYDRQNSDYVILTEIGERTIRWGTGTPINRRYRAAGPTYFEVIELELRIALRDRKENFRGLQMSPSSRRYVARVVEQESRLVLVDDLASTSAWPHNLPEDGAAAKLAAGRDGADTLTPEDVIGFDLGPGERAGLMSLGALEEVAMVCVPDAMIFPQRKPGPEGDMGAQRIHDAMINLCENLKDRFALLDIPMTRDIEIVRRWRRRTDTSYAAYYWPWLGVMEDSGKISRVPPSGHMAGLFAKCDTEVGVHRAPANEPINGVLDLSLVLTEDDQGILNSEAINAFRQSRDIRAWGARTSSSDLSWRFVNVRRLFIMLRRALEEGSRWVIFEPNTPNTWDSVRSRCNAFLEKLYEKGMFAGGSPEESFYVKCDAETNPVEVREQGMLVVEIGVAPAVPAEFIIIRATQKLVEDKTGPETL